MNSYKTGLFAEYLTMLLYKLKFYQIISHRHKTFVGEIDLIALRGRKLVFIEVKSRQEGLLHGTVSVKQQARIRRAAEVFLSQSKKYDGYDIRFDLVVIQPCKWPIIIRNAW